MALLNILLECPSPSCSNYTNFTLPQPHQDINISQPSFSWVQANLQAIPNQVMLEFRGSWHDLNNNPLYLYYMILYIVFMYALCAGLAASLPPINANNLLINEVIEKASLLCFIFSLIFVAIVFPFGIFVAAIAGYALGLFTGITVRTHHFVIIRGKILLVRF